MGTKDPGQHGPRGGTDPEQESTVLVLDRARAGDRQAARVLIERAIPGLRRFTRGRIPDYGRGVADTEDIVQDAVLRMLKQLDSFHHRSVQSLQAYLRQTVVNNVRDVVRRVRRRGVPMEPTEDLPASAPSPLELAIRRESTERFLEAIATLKPADRQAVIWRVELGHSYEEIARQLGKSSADAARMTVTRALRRLAVALGLDTGTPA